MPDQIFTPGPDDAPLKYTVPGSQRMIPRAFQALFDGANSSGNFVPAVVIRSQAGHVIARAILDETIVGGDDAEVSWFPGVKHGAGSPATPVSQPVFVWSADTGTGDFPAGTYQPNIVGAHGNADGQQTFIVSPIDPSQLLVGADGIYSVKVDFAAGDGTLAAGASVSIGATVGAISGGSPSVSVGGDSVNTSVFTELTGVIGPFNLVVNDQIGIHFTVTQHFHFVNGFGGTIWRLGGPQVF